jgi:dTDP-L-rhamnose 4-epimerase
VTAFTGAVARYGSDVLADVLDMPSNTRANLSEMRVLITGGAGFIGTAVARAMAPHVKELVLLDSLHPDVHGLEATFPETPATTFIHGDVTSGQLWQAVLSKYTPTTIIHLAAETGTGLSLSHASRHAHVNVFGTTTMLDALFRSPHRPEHIVLASSRAVYGEGQWILGDQVFYPETRTRKDLLKQRWAPGSVLTGDAMPVPSRAGITEPRPTNIYASTKLAQEHILAAWAAATGTALSVLRLQNVYGPGQSLINSYTGVLALFARLAVCRQPIELFEDGNAIRDFVYIDDVVQALIGALSMTPDNVRLIDIGSGVATTLSRVAEVMAAHEKAPAPFVSGKFREGDVRAASCDITAAKREIGYKPVCGLDIGLPGLLEWVRVELK